MSQNDFDAESYWAHAQDRLFAEGTLYMLSNMQGHHYRRMIHDVKGEEYANRYADYKPQYAHLPDGKKLIGFGGYADSGANSKQMMSHDLVRMLADSVYCDWLDYHGFLRPKWMPDGKSRTLNDCIELIPYAPK